MKKFAVILIFLLCSSCAPKPSPFKAIYLTHGQGELSLEELQAHPEVMVVGTFEEFKRNSHQKIALWIDKNATPLDSAQDEWINAEPQSSYPLVLIGTSDALHAFRDLLKVCCFLGGPPNYPGADAPGFSIILRKPPTDPTAAPVDVPFIHGYDQKPTVQFILEITNDLLEGKIMPSRVSILPQPAKEVPASGMHQVILDSQQPADRIPHAAAKINTLSIRENILTIDVAYQGSCKEHTFELYSSTAFLQSNPPQAVMFLSHDEHGDACTDDVEQELSFDLTTLNEERNDPSEHPVLLRIYEPVGASFATKPVDPLLEWP